MHNVESGWRYMARGDIKKRRYHSITRRRKTQTWRAPARILGAILKLGMESLLHAEVNPGRRDQRFQQIRSRGIPLRVLLNPHDQPAIARQYAAKMIGHHAVPLIAARFIDTAAVGRREPERRQFLHWPLRFSVRLKAGRDSLRSPPPVCGNMRKADSSAFRTGTNYECF